MFKKILFLLVLGTMSFELKARASEGSPKIIFICHKGQNYSADEVKYAFKGYLDEPRPVDNKALFKSMLDFIGYSSTKYDKIWQKMYFRRGLFPPSMMSSDDKVVQYVASSEGGVGYVSTPPKNPNVEICGS